jgi:hypothetical protein
MRSRASAVMPLCYTRTASLPGLLGALRRRMPDGILPRAGCVVSQRRGRATLASRRGNGEGTSWQRDNGTWEGWLTLSHGQRKSIYGKTRDAVRRKLDAWKHDRERGMLVLAGRSPTVASFLGTWPDRTKARRPRREADQIAVDALRTHVSLAMQRQAAEITWTPCWGDSQWGTLYEVSAPIGV